MQHFKNDDINLTELVDKIKQQKLVLILCIIFCLALAVLYNYYSKPIYRASAVVAFENLSDDNIFEHDFIRNQENLVANRMMELRTNSFTKSVYHELPDSIRTALKLLHDQPNATMDEQSLISIIRNNTVVSRGKQAPNTITVSFDSENPEIAQKIANTMTTVLQRNNLKLRRKEFSNTKEFIDGQIGVIKEKLKAAEDSLSAFRKKTNITSPEQEFQELLERISAVESLYNTAQSEKEAKNQSLEFIENKLANNNININTSLLQASNHLITGLTDKLIELEYQYTDLLARDLSDDHPRVNLLKSEIEQVKKRIKQETRDVFQKHDLAGMTDPISQLEKYLEQSITLEIELKALAAQEENLKQILEAYNKRLNLISDGEIRVFGLLRDREVNNNIYVQLLEERERARFREAAEIGNIYVIDPAQKPAEPHLPRKNLNIIIALFTGGIIGLIVIFLGETLHKTPRTPEEIETIFELPVYGTIPEVKLKKLGGRNGHLKNHQLMVNNGVGLMYRDAYSYLWFQLQPLVNEKLQSVMITSAGPSEGKSTVAVNLALTAAKLGKRTLLIDGDFRKPTIHKFFNLSNTSHGLSDAVTNSMYSQSVQPVNGKYGDEDITENILGINTNTLVKETKISSVGNFIADLISLIRPSSDANLGIILAGNSKIQSDVLWTSSELKQGIEHLKNHFDFIVIDSPPALLIPDAITIASFIEGIILCVEAHNSNNTALFRTQKFLEKLNKELLAIVLNKVNPASIYGGFDYQKYYSEIDSKNLKA